METEVWNAGELSQEEVISALRNRFEVSYGKAASELFAFMDEAENEFSLKQVKQIPFCWDVFRSRPQRRYSLASRIIREIIHGSYPAGSYLPSLPHMADRYGVGMNTIRRALDILGGSGNDPILSRKRGQSSVRSLRKSRLRAGKSGKV